MSIPESEKKTIKIDLEEKTKKIRIFCDSYMIIPALLEHNNTNNYSSNKSFVQNEYLFLQNPLHKKKHPLYKNT